MSLFVLLSVVSIVPTLAAKWSGSGFTSNASSTPVVSQYAFAPQLWTQPLPTAVGNNVAASTRIYESVVNATHTLQVLSTVDGNVTTLLTSTNPTAPATIYGTGMLTSFAQNPGQVLTAGPGTTPTSVVIATTRAVFMFDTSFNFDGKSNPSIFQPDGPILAVAWAPTTGLYLVVQSTMLIWWNASTDMIAAPINVTTPLVGPATAQCSSDGVCWIGDSVATFVVVYTNSAVIQTMPMRGQWPADAAMAPVIKPVGGRRAVMAWGVRVGLLTSQQAGNLGMDWKATQTSNTTALGVFPMLGQRGLVVTGHNVSVTVYDLADGSTIGSNGQLQGQLLSGVTYRWTSIEVDTSAQPYLLLASGLNCAASWALVNATGALATAPPAWSAADVLNGFGAFTATYLPSNAASAQGSPWWLIQERQSIDYYSAVLVSPRQQSVVCTLQNRELGGSFVSAVASSTHMIVVVAGPQAIFGIDAAAGPLLAPIATASVFASTLDPATQTTFVVAWDKELGQMSAFKVAFGATTPTLITTWPAANKTTVSFIQDATLALVSNGKLLLSGDFYASSGFSTLWFGAVVDVTSGIVLFQQASASGVAGAFIDTVNNALAFMTQTTYNVVNSTGATTSFPLSVNATVFTFAAQWNNRVLVSLTASGGYWLLDARTGAVLKNQEPSTAYPAFSNDGGILDCVFDDATSVTTLNQYTVNLTLQHSIQVFCNSAPLQTPDGSVYFSAVGALDPHTSMVPTYLARANFDNVAQTPAVELWRSVGGGVGQMIYNAAQQLMLYWDPNSGMQACVDLIRGFTLWNHTAALGVTYSKVSAAQGVVPGAMNVLWADPVPSKFMKTAINLFTGDIIESVLGDTHDDMTYVTSQVINGVNRPVMIVVQAQGTATWTNFAVTDVATPLGFRSSAQPLFTTPLLPQSAVSTPSPPGGSKSPGTGGGGGSDAVGIGIGVTVGIVVVLAIGAFLFLRSRRHTNDTVVDPAYQAMPHTTVRSAASAV